MKTLSNKELNERLNSSNSVTRNKAAEELIRRHYKRNLDNKIESTFSDILTEIMNQSHSCEKKSIIPNYLKDLDYESAEPEMPKSNLVSIKKTMVHVPTQIEYDLLMQFYESGGWKWVGGRLPTNEYWWGRNMSVYADFENSKVKNRFRYSSDLEFCQRNNVLITLKDFYKIQGATPQQILELNNWFEENKPNRRSKEA